MEGLHQRSSMKELAPVRKRLRFTNAFTSTKNRRFKATKLQIIVGLWCVLCASLSILLFTYTLSATVEQNRKLENGPAKIGLGHDLYHQQMPQNIPDGDSTPEDTKMSRPKWKELIKNRVLTTNNHPNELKPSNNPSTKTPTLSNLRVPSHLSAPTTASVSTSVPDHLRIPDDEPVVQIINTRFMQHQPQLVELGMARLELLKTLCLPTLTQQTSQNFLWVIRADPDLNETVRKSLLEVINQATQNSTSLHVVVIGSNNNPMGFRRDLVDQPDQIWTDNFALLQHFHEAAQSRIVLETRLDADDGLHIFFVEIMQEDAVKQLKRKHNWLVWCAGTHVEWQYGTPWEDWPGANQTRVGDSSYGSLLPGLTRGCITPGLTKGYAKDVAFEDVPEAQHHQLHWKMKRCDEEKEDWEQCLVIWKRLVPTAIRGRTPTSAGMQFVLGKHVSELSQEAQDALGLGDDTMLEKQDMMWNSVIRRFSITKESVRSMRTYLTEHMHMIALDNLEGQCTKGHSCKNSSQEILQHLVEDTNTVKVSR